MKMKEMKERIEEIITAKEEAHLRTRGSDNPQVLELATRVDAEINVFLSVLDAINGKPAALENYPRGRFVRGGRCPRCGTDLPWKKPTCR